MGLENVIQEVRKEIGKLNHVLRLLTGTARKQAKSPAPRRKMSAAARRRISLAQKARWKKWKAKK
jgi:hypothetical protein